jgi:hypothetical protein
VGVACKNGHLGGAVVLFTAVPCLTSTICRPGCCIFPAGGACRDGNLGRCRGAVYADGQRVSAGALDDGPGAEQDHASAETHAQVQTHQQMCQ